MKYSSKTSKVFFWLVFSLLFIVSLNVELKAQIKDKREEIVQRKVIDLEEQLNYFSRDVYALKKSIEELESEKKIMLIKVGEMDASKSELLSGYKVISAKQGNLERWHKEFDKEMTLVKENQLLIQNDIQDVLNKSRMLLLYTLLLIIGGLVLILGLVNLQLRKHKLNWFSLLRDALNN